MPPTTRGNKIHSNNLRPFFILCSVQFQFVWIRNYFLFQEYLFKTNVACYFRILYIFFMIIWLFFLDWCGVLWLCCVYLQCFLKICDGFVFTIHVDAQDESTPIAYCKCAIINRFSAVEQMFRCHPICHFLMAKFYFTLKYKFFALK